MLNWSEMVRLRLIETQMTSLSCFSTESPRSTLQVARRVMVHELNDPRPLPLFRGHPNSFQRFGTICLSVTAPGVTEGDEGATLCLRRGSIPGNTIKPNSGPGSRT